MPLASWEPNGNQRSHEQWSLKPVWAREEENKLRKQAAGNTTAASSTGLFKCVVLGDVQDARAFMRRLRRQDEDSNQLD